MSAKSIIRNTLGESNSLTHTANKAADALFKAGIPHLIVGGYALQEYGYYRFTSDVDIVVPDVAQARDVLSMNGFKENPGSSMSLTDRVNKNGVDLLPGGKRVGPGEINLPMPSTVSQIPALVSVEELVSQKLSSWYQNRISRAKDLGDVVELIKASSLPRTLAVRHPDLRDQYRRIWDDLHGHGQV